MSNSVHFVTVTNTGKKSVYLMPPKKTTAREVELHDKIKLEPRKPSHPLPYDLLTHTRYWKRWTGNGRLAVQDVAFEPAFVRVENLSKEPIHLEIILPAKADEGSEKTESVVHRVVLEPGETSTPLCRARVCNLSSVANSVSLEPVGYIGPPVDSKSGGSFGSERVYYCYKCGGPIVFRSNGGPYPVHI